MILAITIVQLVCAVVLVAIVLFQSGKSAGLSSAIAGGNNDSYMSRNKKKSMDAKLSRATKWIGLAFAVLTLAIYIFQ